MSETVKLIIEMPKAMYEKCKKCKLWSYDVETLEGTITKGTLLDDVKAKIKKNILDEPVENGTNAEMACYNGGLLKGLEIIDKYISKTDKRSKIRCNTCKNNDDEFSGECYECVKNIQNHYKAKESED